MGLYLARLDLRQTARASALHRLWRIAYAQEAALLGLHDFAPLRRSLPDLQQSDECFFGAWSGTALIGAIGLEVADVPRRLRIGALIVDPQYQRRGVARRLLTTMLARFGGYVLSVTTAAANRPALALYAGCGFAERQRFSIQPEALEVVELERRPG
ncbi:MAG: GNAT family N-acetyltransferase [Betaproteobacteria bacterium]